MRLFLIAFICILYTVDSNAQWTDITPPGFPSYSAFTDAAYLGADTFFISATEGMLIRTYDGGHTYVRDSSIRNGLYNNCPDTPQSDLESIHFINDTIGVTAGQDGIFYKSVDGGINWKCKFLPGSPGIDVSDIYFWNRSEGVALCEYCSALYYTNDGGLDFNSWVTRNVDHPNEIVSTSYASYIASENGVYQSTDSGFTWHQITMGSDKPFIAIDALGEKIIAIGDNGSFLQSGDSGQSWRYVLDQKFAGYSLKKVAFINNENVIFISQAGSFTEAYLLYCDFSLLDILKVDTLQETGKIKEVNFVDDSTGYIIAWKKILKTTNKAGLTGIRKNQEIRELSVWPNPSSD